MTHDITRRGLAAFAAAGPLALIAPGARAASMAPRLFFTPERIARARTWKDGDLAAAWRIMAATVNALHRDGPDRYGPHANSTDRERGWQREVGNGAATLAAAALMTGQKADRDLAIAHVVASADYAVWGRDDMDGADLAAAHLLFGAAMVLDWLGEGMDAQTRATIVGLLRRRGGQMAAAARGAGVKRAYWADQWMQNHLWVNMGGLLAAGLALQRDDPGAAAPMIATASDLMARAFAALPADGSSQEGPGYWEYGAEYLLKYHHLATELLGQKLDGHWLHGAAGYRCAMAIPEASWTRALSLVNQADAPLSPWYGPEYMLRRLAALNRDGVAQEMATRLEAVGAVHATAPWLNFVWYDPAVRPGGAEELPLLTHFTDLDLVVARGDRTGHEAMVVMRAGPPLGKRAQARRDTHDVGVAHTHPDVNHVTLFGAGAFLLRDDGYAGAKQTAQHSTLMVNGQGQIGDGHEWTSFPHYPLPDPQPSMTVVATDPAFDYFVGEGAAAYPAAAGLRRFDRHVLFVKPGLLVVIDDLEAAGPAEFTLLWHPGAAARPVGEGRYEASASGAALRIAFTLPEGASHAPAQRQVMSHEKAAAALDEIAVTVSGQARAQCGALFTWGADSAPPAEARLEAKAGVFTLHAPGGVFLIHPRERRVVRA